MENNPSVKLSDSQKEFVELANSEGFDSTITRKDIISLQGKHGIKKPAWLMKNMSYRIGRAQYSLPTIGQVMSESSDSVAPTTNESVSE
tara:strand:- start:829 stop:1095 length:267 start_codon:yes stop_codon:yes gene_type:complete